MPKPKSEAGAFTPQQGQYLRFLYDYQQENGKVPSQSKIAEHFRLSSASGMLKTLESRGLISREPGDPQSLKILVPPHQLPLPEGGAVLPFLGKFGDEYPNLARWIAMGGRLDLGFLPTAMSTALPVSEGAHWSASRPEGSLVRLAAPDGLVWVGIQQYLTKSPDDLLKEAEGEVLAFFPEPPRAEKIPVSTTLYQLKVTLCHSDPAIWRRFVVPAEVTLAYLHDAIQIAFGWDNSHLHYFRHGSLSYGPVANEDEDEDDFFTLTGDFDRDEKAVPLTEILRKPKDKFIYEYDFGDSWKHDIVLEKLLPNDQGTAQLRCTDGKRAAPVDDCGGIWGFEQLVLAHADRLHPDHKNAVSWLGKGFDPERVDLETINKKFAKLS